MKIEKITPQIAALYIGQMCTVDWPSRFIEETKITHKALVWPDEDGVIITPHLRRLDSMTEEEAREVYQIENFEVWNTQMYSQEEPLNGSCLDKWWNILLEDIYIKQSDFRIGTPAVWLYLLSKGFDLFDLIPAGLAKEVTP